MPLDLKTCAALKAAGMPWEPKKGDMFYWKNNVIIYNDFYSRIVAEGSESEFCTWIPRLDQILALIEAEGYFYELSVDNMDKPPYCVTIEKGRAPVTYLTYFTADTPGSACAAAYLWILQTKNKEG